MERVFGKLTEEQRERHQAIREKIELEKPDISERDRLARKLRALSDASKAVLEIAEQRGLIDEEYLAPLRDAISASDL